MTIRHTVAFRLTDPAGERRFVADARSALTAIPGVRDFEVSRQVSAKSAFALQFSMVFADQEAYTAYNEHPDHVAFVADRWAGEVAEFEELDFVLYPTD